MAMMIASEIAAELKVSLPAAYRLLKTMPGTLKIGRSVRIERRLFEQWLRDQQRDQHADNPQKSAA
jgi:hypothetical protein